MPNTTTFEFTSFACRRTPVGLVGIGESGGLVTRLLFMQDDAAPVVTSSSSLLDEALRQLDAWFSGRLREFSLPLVEPRTAFERRVREAMLRIPYGATASYGELAAAIGSPGAARAVGTACGRNPLPLIVPCHRVVAAGGRIGGFLGGIEMKRWLLDFERRNGC
ncbi:cysteine methyltransferase [Chlorobaculum limnaeum]|uniref:Methylated-DNA--protein-cysteine methyltransferase n=1 Tax=Chlorobaculum limnaeum TaxID=274537 RepID=A0A1D8D1X6_CHLLM|nr:methylated-DNA--[protein]-cysteine S-methyltransferase [Chlorobaculum limnaeum]AOS83465.1 cysteine methyltransferase [Chlorobaculum limnaeum]